jgi:Cu(I)/Ag(I) efflux system protein CusF
MKNIAMLSLFLTLFAMAGLPASGMDMGNMNSDAAQNAESEAIGVIEEIDAAKGVLTISHEPIKSLGWPAMTMDFVVKDKKMLGKVAKGKKIRFTFIQQHGDYLITKIR